MNNNHFDYVPSTVERRRSVFKFDQANARSAYVGFLYPICKPVRVMPGTSISLDIAAEIRSGGLIAPLMDEMYCDVYSFFVPNRIVWEHWKQFIGAVDDVLFNNLSQYQIPSFNFGINQRSDLKGLLDSNENFGWNQLIACHFGLEYPLANLPSGVDYQSLLTQCPKISALPFRGYTFIWNEFFRPEQITSPLVISKTDAGFTGMNITAGHRVYSGYQSLTFDLMIPDNFSGATQTVPFTGGAILKTYRAHRSLWTSCLPAPSLETLNLLAGLTAPIGVLASNSGTTSSVNYPGVSSGTTFTADNFYKYTYQGQIQGDVYADLNQTLLTVNNYRETIMLQNYYDVLNRAGSRYDEIIYNIFGVRAGNAVIDIPELITHKRFTIYRNQVVATANSSNSDGNVEPIGTQGAYIDTIVKDSFFTRSFTEHGYVHLMYTIRPARIRYSAGIEPEWRELDKFSLYYPQFDGMGDVDRSADELYWDFYTPSNNGSIFGYQEYGAVWKYQRSDTAGFLDPHTANPIKGMNLTENLQAAPVLNDDYLSCLGEFIAFSFCCNITDPNVAPHFVIDWRLNGTIAHPMPVYNIPGQGALL